MNNFARNIGIWYYDRKWAEVLFEKILDSYPGYCLFRIYRNQLKIILTDGTSIRFFNVNCTSRSMALTESYIQKGIDYNLFCSKIAPATKRGIKGKYIIENYNDIENPQDATRYYLKKNCEKEEEMDLVQLPDGQIDTVGNKHHVIDIVREKCGDDIARIISQWINPENTGEMKKWRDSFKEEFEEEKRQEEMAIIEKLNKIYCT